MRRRLSSLRLQTFLVAFVALLTMLFVGIAIGSRPQLLPSWFPFVDDDTRLVAEARDWLESTYYRKPVGEKLTDAAVAGMVGSLDDRFSAYFAPAEYRRFKQVQRSEFTGIGVTVIEHRRGLRISQVFDDSPAKRAGLRDGDLIVAVDGRSLRGLTQERSTSLIKGPRGTDVTLTIVSRGKRRRERIERATVTVPSVSSRLRRLGGKRIGYIALSQFGPGDHARVYAALRRLRRRGARGYVFDLRSNGGGLVSEAQLVASAFLRDGPIVTTEGRSVRTRTLEATGDPIVPTAPLVVLVDRDTASAAEIVAGALQDRGRATVVGLSTFGKGVFQEVIELSNGGALDITAGRYLTPKGRNLGGVGVRTGAGVKPDVRARDDRDTARDEALAVALRVLRRRL